jgi:hypothetical protein
MQSLQAEYLAGLALLQPTADRQAYLRKNWGFTCNCRRCCPPVALSTLSSSALINSSSSRSSRSSSNSSSSSSSSSRSSRFSPTEATFDRLDLPPTRGWTGTLHDAMSGVARGAVG